MSKCRMWKKPLARKEYLIQTKKLGLEWAVNGLGKPFRKNPIQKIEKKCKNQSETAACEQKNHNRETEILFKHRFLTTLKLKWKKFTPQNNSLFRSISCFGVTKNHYSNLTSKIMKMCEQILKERQRPNTIQILWIKKRAL